MIITKIKWDAAKPGELAWYDKPDREQKGLYVYVAGPITGTGNPDEKVGNVWQGMDAALNLIEVGHYPYCPHLSFFLHKGRSLPYETWIDLSRAWLDRSDALIRLPGESKGADREVARAYNQGIPVYWSVGSFLKAAAAGKVYRHHLGTKVISSAFQLSVETTPLRS